MTKSDIRFRSFPATEPPPYFAGQIVEAFRFHEEAISTLQLSKGLTSDQVLNSVRDSLVLLGFQVESGKQRNEKIDRPVYFGENGEPILRYEIDAYHADWRCGLEIEAGRAWMGNAVYRDLIQALVMVQVEVLAIAVPNAYRYFSSGKTMVSKDYENLVNVAATLYGHTRFQFPYRLLVIGY